MKQNKLKMKHVKLFEQFVNEEKSIKILYLGEAKKVSSRDVEKYIKKYKFDDEVIRDIIENIFIEDPKSLEHIEKSEYTDEIAKWIEENEFDIADWFKEMDELYNITQ